MKNYPMLLLCACMPVILPGQNEGILYHDAIRNSKVEIDHIFQYEASFPLADSAKINPRPEQQGLLLENAEYYDQGNLLKRVESYKQGKISLAYDYQMEDGKPVSAKEDTRYDHRGFSKTYRYLPDNSVHVTHYYSEGKPDYWIMSYDCNNRLIGEYNLNQSGDTTSWVRYTYDSEGRQMTQVSRFGKNRKQLSTIYLYNPAGQLIKFVTFNMEGDLTKENTYRYFGENKQVVTHRSYPENTTKYSTTIEYLDQYGNVVKRYSNSQYKPDVWTLTQYDITYSSGK